MFDFQNWGFLSKLGKVTPHYFFFLGGGWGGTNLPVEAKKNPIKEVSDTGLYVTPHWQATATYPQCNTTSVMSVQECFIVYLWIRTKNLKRLDKDLPNMACSPTRLFSHMGLPKG